MGLDGKPVCKHSMADKTVPWLGIRLVQWPPAKALASEILQGSAFVEGCVDDETEMCDGAHDEAVCDGFGFRRTSSTHLLRPCSKTKGAMTCRPTHMSGNLGTAWGSYQETRGQGAMQPAVLRRDDADARRLQDDANAGHRCTTSTCKSRQKPPE